MFSTSTLYRLVCGVPIESSVLEDALNKAQFVPTGPTQQQSAGWVAPRGEEHGAMVEAIGGQLFIRLRTEVRKVPGPAVKRHADEIADQIEESTGRRPGKKQMKEIKEQALLELLPSAIPGQFDTWAWIDPKSCVMVVDSTSPGKLDQFVTLLVKAMEDVNFSLIQTEMSPAVAMAHWLGTGEPPYQFSVDRECALKSPDEMKSVVRYSRHPLDTDEVKQHIQAGKVPTHLALTWRDRVSFVLTDSGKLKKLSFLDIVFEGPSSPAGGKVDKSEAFEADCAIFTGEMLQLIPDLLDALGGEAAPLAPPQTGMAAEKTDGESTTDAQAPWDQHLEADGPDPLYPDACEIIVANQKASISLVQRHLHIGYNRAARILEQMEKAGLISPTDAKGNRQINDLVNQAERQAIAEAAQ
ncbi:MAG: recombination-associated protein RdgC [Gammaproteobacteria bacterium]|nr:recombination-associated protein RdgC [Gammaproteobacteria bacterium]